MYSKKIGWFLVLSPGLSLLFSLIFFSFLQTLLPTQDTITLLRVMRIILGLLGIYGTLGIFTAFPFGIFILIKNRENRADTQTPTQQEVHMDSTDIFVKNPSFSAFFFTFVYLVANKMWKWLLIYMGLIIFTAISTVSSLFLGIASIFNGGSLGPIVGVVIFSLVVLMINLVFRIYLLFRGRYIAWNEGANWDSIEQFKQRQKMIFWVGFILFFITSLVIPYFNTINLSGNPTISSQTVTEKSADVTQLEPALAVIGSKIENGGFYSTNAVLGRIKNTYSDSSAASDVAFKMLTGIFSGEDHGLDDSDSDGIRDINENNIGTNSTLKDSDADGFNDFEELKSGYNPTLANSKLGITSNEDILGTWYNTDNDYITLTLNPDGTATISAPKQKFVFPKFYWKLQNGSLLFAPDNLSLTFNNPLVAIHPLVRTSEGITIVTSTMRPILVAFRHK